MRKLIRGFLITAAAAAVAFAAIYLVALKTSPRVESGSAVKEGQSQIRYSLPDGSVAVDSAWYRKRSLEFADLWDGGIQSMSGMGAFLPDFNGYFQTTLDRYWNPTSDAPITAVSQSRAIYLNVEASKVAPADRRAKYISAVRLGADYLLKAFPDPLYGGFFWSVDPEGKPIEMQKDAYGQVHPLMALARAYGVTGDRTYLDAAVKQYRFLKKNFADDWYPGAYLPSRSRDLSRGEGINNSDVFTHWFEALLALYDVTDGSLRSEIASDIGASGEFLVRRLYRDEAGRSDRGYVAYYYTPGWEPSWIPFKGDQWNGSGYASPGHGIELAFLLSRAVERGLGDGKGWLACGEKMIAFCLAHAFDGTTGAMLYDICGYDGAPLARNNEYVYWPQCESARALLHYAVVRGKTEYFGQFKKVEAFIHGILTDREAGGLWPRVEKDMSVPDSYKGNIWKTNYHFNMFVSEVIRLADTYPDRVKSFGA